MLVEHRRFGILLSILPLNDLPGAEAPFVFPRPIIAMMCQSLRLQQILRRGGMLSGTHVLRDPSKLLKVFH